MVILIDEKNAYTNHDYENFHSSGRQIIKFGSHTTHFWMIDLLEYFGKFQWNIIWKK